MSWIILILTAALFWDLFTYHTVSTFEFWLLLVLLGGFNRIATALEKKQ